MEQEKKKFEIHKADRLISKEREEQLKPDRLLADIGLKPGMKVADIGCGNGFFTLPAAKRIEPGGVLYALDVSEAMLKKLQERDLPPNVQLRLSREYSFSLEDQAVDVVLLGAVVHEVDDPRRFLLEVNRVLKQNGKVWVLEWVPKTEEKGPPEHHRISQEELKNEIMHTGFTIRWAKPIGDSLYHLLAQKSG